MSKTMIIGAAVLLVLGILLFFKSTKVREENGEWSGTLQWGYLLMLVGTFGLLSALMSFTAVLLLFVLFTGIAWCIHRRKKKMNSGLLDDNHFTDYMSGFFPIILVVFILRTFVAEPFQIPSSSMRPGLIPGDFILVNKFVYGIRLPVLNNVLIPVSNVERGDVMVFNYPEDTRKNYIKRVIGLPGDVVTYKDKTLSINDKVVNDIDEQKLYNYAEQVLNLGTMTIHARQLNEQLGNKSVQVLQIPQQPAVILQGVRPDFPDRELCTYYPDGSGFSCTVPAGKYFMMGDNRDNSDDSRYWGFVDDKLVVGKAFLIWLNIGDMKRIGTKIQ
ncbi:signal peptidase I [Snodgrassella alvi]|uniref:Signal peptidase I n=1 Tax=Snodgrassella alvi TaxID=1196083 RepID=A0A855G7Z7_9NEIS|nr:signal peptidase I [Snodgrassella alvi]PIT60065.1 signal peptidase I [Snodgrassella alvi]